jgi:hypothetical protein
MFLQIKMLRMFLSTSSRYHARWLIFVALHFPFAFRNIDALVTQRTSNFVRSLVLDTKFDFW